MKLLDPGFRRGDEKGLFWPIYEVIIFVLLRITTWEKTGMFPGFTRIIEERIQKAFLDGEFENLSGSGKPLRLEDDRHVPEDLRLAHKILKNADCLPPEIELKKEIQRTEDLLADMKDAREKYRLTKKLNFLILRLNTLRNASVALDIPQHYTEKLVARMEKNLKK